MDAYDFAVEPACDTCGDGTLAILGILGSRLHLRCQGCGMDCSTTDPAQVAEAEELLAAVDFC